MNAPARRAVWDILPAEWAGICSEMGLPAYRASQIVTGFYQGPAQSWPEITTLPTALRQELSERFPCVPLVTVQLHEADDGVEKLLLKCSDGDLIESVLIPSKGRMTQCISSQVGCSFGCAFCASGRQGRLRDLSSAEIVGQVMAACALMRREAAPIGPGLPGTAPPLPRPGNIVVMGMGEPFDNYANVLRALRILNDQKGLNIGARHITISTCGVVPGIKRLATEGTQFELSVSLHAPDDALRSTLMPVNRRWPLAELLATCRDYNKATGRLVTFEYTLIKNLNDRARHAEALIKLLRDMPCKVNLIPLSPVAGFAGECPEHRTCLAFLDALLKAGLPTTMRKSRGRNINAACGQLRLTGIAANQ